MLSNRSSASRWCDSRFYTEEVQGAGWGESGRIRASKETESGGLLQDGGRVGGVVLCAWCGLTPVTLPGTSAHRQRGSRRANAKLQAGLPWGSHLPLAEVSPGLFL